MRKNEVNQYFSDVYGKKYYLRAVQIFILAVISSVANFMVTWHTGSIIDSVGLGFLHVVNYTIIIVISVVLYLLSNILLTYIKGSMSNFITSQFRKQLGKKICKSDYEQLDQISEGNLLSTASNDVEGLVIWFDVLADFGHIPIKLLLTSLAFIWIDWRLFVLFIIAMPVILLPSVLISKKMYSLNKEERQAIANNTNFLKETLSFFIVVKSFCLEKKFIKTDRRNLDVFETIQLKKNIRNRAIQSFSRCVGYILYIAIFITGGNLILKNEITLGLLITNMLMIDITYEGITMVSNIMPRYQGVKACINRIANILNLPDERSGSYTIKETHDEPIFTIQRLSFSYSDKLTLDHIELTITRGEKVAVLGESGSGKTTLFKLLCGLYVPSEGNIYLKGHNLSDISANALKSCLSIVPQESFIFSDTIKNNILMAKPDASDEELECACKYAQIHDFILSLEHGYHTMLDGVIVSLSNGQMQRINLARAFLKNTEVWLFDEPTSALDVETRNRVMEHIINDTDGKTVICIIHDQDLSLLFDTVVHMKKGTISDIIRK